METLSSGATEPQERVVPMRSSAFAEHLRYPTLVRMYYRLQPLLGYLLLFLVVYSAAWIVPYGFNDDYLLLWRSVQHQFGTEMVVYVVDGRPICGLLETVGYHFLNTVADLRYLRGAGIIGIAFFAWLVYRASMTSGMERRLALVLPIMVCCMPAFQILAGWAILAATIVASIAAGVALLLVHRAVELPALKQRLLLLGGAVALLLVALLIYQPGAMVYWLFAAITLFTVDSRLSRMLRRFGLYLAVMLVALGLAFAVLRVLPGIVYSQQTLHDPLFDVPQARSQLIGLADIPSKFVWFLVDPSLDAMNLAQISASAVVVGVSSCIMWTGMALHFRGHLWERVVKLGLAMVLLPLSYLPNLMVYEDWGTYRTEIALGSIVVFYLVVGLSALVRANSSKLGLRVAIVVLSVSAVAFALTASWNVTRYVAVPQYAEYALLRTQLATKITNATASVYLIPEPSVNGSSQVPSLDEFAVPSSGLAQDQPQMVWLALREVAPKRHILPVVVASDSSPSAPARDSIVIDMRQLRYLLTSLW